MMPLILKSLQILVCLKLAPLGNTLIFGPIPFAPPTLSWHYCYNIVKDYKIPSFDMPENFVIPNTRSSAFKFKDFVKEAISELIERGCVIRKLLIHPSLSILYTWCSSPVGNAGLFWIFRF